MIESAGSSLLLKFLSRTPMETKELEAQREIHNHTISSDEKFHDILFRNENEHVRRLIQPCHCIWRNLSVKNIPFLVICARGIINFAFGFGLFYFPSFIDEEVDVDVARNSIMYIFMPYLSVAAFLGAALLARRKGRGEVICLCYSIAVISLLVVVILNACLSDPSLYYLYPCIIIFIFATVGPVSACTY